MRKVLTVFALVFIAFAALTASASARCDEGAQTCNGVKMSFAARELYRIIDQHPDLPCDTNCYSSWLEHNPWLQEFAYANALPVSLVVQASISFSYQWGIDATRLFNRPLTQYDWDNAYYDIANAFADRLGVEKPFRSFGASHCLVVLQRSRSDCGY
jgi:hypothetical protein